MSIQYNTVWRRGWWGRKYVQTLTINFQYFQNSMFWGSYRLCKNLNLKTNNVGFYDFLHGSTVNI